MPRSLRDVLNNLGRHGNPWEPSAPRHSAWLKELDARDFSEGDTADLCYYVGSLASDDGRNQAVAKSMVKVMKAAGVDFALLGKEETDCGDTARRLGEDGLFETLVEGSYATFADLGVSSLVTTSPHAYHTMNREYPAMRRKLKLEDAPDIRVRHHTQLVAGLIRDGALTLTRVEKRVAFHDPCYLGRHNGVYEEPRELLKAIPGVELVELPRSRESSFCCGGGGGRMWLESGAEHRIAELRALEAGRAGVDVLATACPYCMSNLTDGIKVAGYGDTVEGKDVVELVAEAI
ncbi:MAG: (Fe-S)-binding protein [Chloroflexota bacterium]